MRRVALVRRRDGEVVPFDEGLVQDAVHRALLAAGREDPLLAGEISSVVTLFLEKTYYDEVPTVEQVEDMVEKVLLETGHSSAARAFILHRDRETRLRESEAGRPGAAEPTLFDAGAIVVDDGPRGVSVPFSREALARTLAADGIVPRASADEVAQSVEVRLRRAGVARAPWSFVRALAEVELLERGAPVELRRRVGALLEPERIAASFLRRGGGDAGALPVDAARDLGEAALRAHSLAEILPAEVARAHLDGDLHVHGLGAPAGLHDVAWTPDSVKRGTAPGGGTRGPEDAALTARRLSASLGRATRFVAAAARRSTVAGIGPSFAPLVASASREALADEAWHLVLEACSDDPRRRVVLDLSPDLPDARAATPAVGGAGEDLGVPAGELRGVATAFAAAALRALVRGTGLPPRDVLPVPLVGIGERTLSEAASRDVLRLAAETAVRGERVVFAFRRPGTDATGPEASCCAGRVTLNLPRAARRAGRGNVEGFLRHCDRIVDLAAAAHRHRREILGHVAAAAGGPLAPLFRAARGRAPFLSLADATWSFGLTGLNEALVHVTGFELHDGDETVARTAERILSYLTLRVREAGLASDLHAVLDATEDPAAARRLYECDLRSEPERTRETLPATGYTPGVGVRRDAPVDLLHRLEREDPLHASLACATVVLPVRARDSGGPDGAVALLSKCLRASRVHRAEIVAW